MERGNDRCGKRDELKMHGMGRGSVREGWSQFKGNMSSKCIGLRFGQKEAKMDIEKESRVQGQGVAKGQGSGIRGERQR